MPTRRMHVDPGSDRLAARSADANAAGAEREYAANDDENSANNLKIYTISR